MAEPRPDLTFTHPMVENVVSKIGIHATEPGDPCGSGMHLHLSPALLDDDGHVDFGVLGSVEVRFGSRGPPVSG